VAKAKQFLHDKGVWVAGISAGVIVLLLIIFGAALSNKSDEVKKLEASLTSARTERDEVAKEVSSAEDKVSRIEGLRGKILSEAEDKAASIVGSAKGEAEEAEENIGSLEAKVGSKEQALASVESSLEGAEHAKSLSTFGEGVMKAEVDYSLGTTYEAPGEEGCYWALLNSANTNDTESNEFTNNATQQIVTIESPYFTSEGCGTWKQIAE
jgi:F0F1-type ATP synthase membrane subunit b/b'